MYYKTDTDASLFVVVCPKIVKRQCDVNIHLIFKESIYTIDLKEAERIIRNGFGNELLKVACDCIAPFYWHCIEPDGTRKINNGTVFFLDIGNSRFTVTAYHVCKGFEDPLLKK